MNTRTRILGAMIAAVAGVALAQTPSTKKTPSATPPPRIDFATLDKNADGSLSKEESVTIADLEAQFDKLDADKNAAVSPAEFAAWSRAGKTLVGATRDPATAPGGSAGAQHMSEHN